MEGGGGVACADKQNASRDLVWSRLARPTIDASHLDLHVLDAGIERSQCCN